MKEADHAQSGTLAPQLKHVLTTACHVPVCVCLHAPRLQVAKERSSSLELQVSRLSQQLSATEAQASRLSQQLTNAEAHNTKLSQQLTTAEADAHALRTELSAQQHLKQQLEATCDQLRVLQQEGQRAAAQARQEAAEATHEAMVSPTAGGRDGSAC